MNKIVLYVVLAGITVVFFILSGAMYIVDETQQAVITQFGKPIGEPVIISGLHFKAPFIQHVDYFEKRILEWDGDPNQIPTKDKKYIWIDTIARWRIKGALKFLQSVTNETGAHAILDDIIDSTTRDFIAKNNLVEIIRDTNRIIDESTMEEKGETSGQIATKLGRIEFGRNALTRSISEEASKIMPLYGIELIDVRIKRINYVSEVQKKVFERMISERKRMAERYRAEGRGKKAEIEGQIQKELSQISSEAYKIAEGIKGAADAEAIKIYANGYSRDPEFYSFLKTLDTYKDTIDKNTTVIFSTDMGYFDYLKNSAKKAKEKH